MRTRSSSISADTYQLVQHLSQNLLSEDMSLFKASGASFHNLQKQNDNNYEHKKMK